MKIFIWIFSTFFLLNETALAFCPSAPANCSYAAVNENLEDFNGSMYQSAVNKTFGGLSPNEACKSAIPAGTTKPSNDKIYAAMMEDPRITSYVNPSTLGCFKNSAGSEEQKIKALSRYAYTQMRFDRTAEGLQDYIAFADVVNGKVPLEGVDCAKKYSELTKAVEACQRVQSQCKTASKAAAEELVKEYQKEFKSVDVPGLNKRIKDIKTRIQRSAANARGRKPLSPEALDQLQIELAEKEIKLEMFYSSYPWSRQSTFNSAIRQGKNPTEALRLQVTENADNAKKQMNEIRKASACMLRNNCDPDDITEALKKIPRENSASYNMKKGDTKENNQARGAVTQYLDYNRCLDERADDWEETNGRIIEEASLPIGLVTIPLTMGGSLALTGLTLGGRAVVSAASVGSRTFAAATAATRVGTVASAALATPQVQKAAEHCGEKAKAQLGTKFSEPKNQCSLVDSQSVAFKTKYDDCFMQAVMATLSAGGAAAGLRGLASAGKATAGAGANAEKVVKDTADTANKTADGATKAADAATKAGDTAAKTADATGKAADTASKTTNAVTGAEASAEKMQKFLEASKKSAAASKDGGKLVASPEQLKLANSLEPAERVGVAKSLLGKENLSKTQEEAIIKAHEYGKGGFGTYTDKEIAEKALILKRAGFKKDEIDKLMRNGVTGKLDSVAFGPDTGGAKQLITADDHYNHAGTQALKGEYGAAQHGFNEAASKASIQLNATGNRELVSVAALERPMVYEQNLSKIMMGKPINQQDASQRIITAAKTLETKYGVEASKTVGRELDALQSEVRSQTQIMSNPTVRNKEYSHYDQTTKKTVWKSIPDEQVESEAAFKAYKANEMRRRLAKEAFDEDRPAAQNLISEEEYKKIIKECEEFDKVKTGALKRIREAMQVRY